MLHMIQSPVAPRHGRASLVFVLLATLMVAGTFQGCGGGGSSSENRHTLNGRFTSNRLAVDTSGVAHAGATAQVGPCRSSRAMAIVHIAMFEALIAMKGGYQSILNLPNPGVPISGRVA